MAQRLKDRVKESTISVGTGTITLGGVSGVGLLTFATAAGNGETVPYLIDANNGDWELTWGTITAGPPDTITRGTLIASSTGTRVSFNAGTKTVALVLPAELTLFPGVSPAMAETSIASAATTDLGAAAVPTFQAVITGTTTITSFGTSPNTLRFIRFAASLLLTYNATSLITPTAANIQTAAGDTAIAVSDGAGNWRIISYTRASGPVAASGASVTVNASGSNICSISLPAGKWRLSATATYVGAGSSGAIGAAICIGQTSASFSGATLGLDWSRFVISATIGGGAIAGTTVTLTATTTVYLVAAFIGSVSDTMSGTLRADPII
jgi:hypothetical protein